jgi:hypothetical protein
MTLRLGLENQVSDGKGISVGKKAGQLGRINVPRAADVIQTLEGTMILGEAVVREAIPLMNLRVDDKKQAAFLHGLARDGYAVEVDDNRKDLRLTAALPEEIDLPASDDEVHDSASCTSCRFPMAISIRQLKRTGGWPPVTS